MKVSVVIPVYDESATIIPLLQKVRAVPLEKEIIVVDDGSTDGTTQILRRFESEGAREFCDARNELKILFHDRNLGKGAALRTGFAKATGSVILIQDADLEYDPSDYPKLIQPILDGKADVVYGSRFAGHPRRVLYFWHTVGNKLLTFLSNIFTNLNLTDVWSGYKVFRADVLKSIEFRSDRFGFEPEFTAKVAHHGFRIYEVPVSYSGRTYAEGKKIGWRDGISGVRTILYHAIWRDPRPRAHEHETLARVTRLRRYNAWLWEKAAPYVGDDVLEIGAGLGTMTRSLLGKRRVIVTESNPVYVRRLRESFGALPHVEVMTLDLERIDARTLAVGVVDTVVGFNVLEHVADDEGALRGLVAFLRPGGRIVLVLPAVKGLYGAMDRAIGHHRRYGRGEIVEKLQRAGLTVERVEFFNVPGMIGWWLNSRLLGRRTVPGVQARVNDRLVPALRLERWLRLPFGMSVLVVGRRAAEPPGGAAPRGAQN